MVIAEGDLVVAWTWPKGLVLAKGGLVVAKGGLVVVKGAW